MYILRCGCETKCIYFFIAFRFLLFSSANVQIRFSKCDDDAHTHTIRVRPEWFFFCVISFFFLFFGGVCFASIYDDVTKSYLNRFWSLSNKNKIFFLNWSNSIQSLSFVVSKFSSTSFKCLSFIIFVLFFCLFTIHIRVYIQPRTPI